MHVDLRDGRGEVAVFVDGRALGVLVRGLSPAQVLAPAAFLQLPGRAVTLLRCEAVADGFPTTDSARPAPTDRPLGPAAIASPEVDAALEREKEKNSGATRGVLASAGAGAAVPQPPRGPGAPFALPVPAPSQRVPFLRTSSSPLAHVEFGEDDFLCRSKSSTNALAVVGRGFSGVKAVWSFQIARDELA